MSSSIADVPRGTVRIAAMPGVFRPRSDARLLAAVMRAHGFARDATVLDVFTGSGVLAIAAAREGARAVKAVDISRRAVLTARANARRNNVEATVRVHRGDLFAPLGDARFDLILANPPYLPGPQAAPPRHGPARAWEGGRDGRLLIDRLIDGTRERLAPGGRLLFVQSSLTGEGETLARLEAAGLSVHVLARERGPLGQLAARRIDVLRDGGRLAPGEDEEELIVAAAEVAASCAASSSWSSRTGGRPRRVAERSRSAAAGDRRSARSAR